MKTNDNFGYYMTKLLIIGPSYRRIEKEGLIPAIERYNGVFYRVTRKNNKNKDLLIFVLTEDLELIDAASKIPYRSPKGEDWKKTKNPDHTSKYIEKMKGKNTLTLKKILDQGTIDEIFIAAGAIFRRALPTLDYFKGKIILPRGGIGPTAKLLKDWLSEK